MDLVSGKVVPGCSNAGNPFHECTAICFERLNSRDVHKKEKKLFGFGKRTPSRDQTPPGSPARGSRSPLASYFAKKKVESSESSPSSNDHTNGNFLSRLSPLQGRKIEPSSNVDSLPVSPSLALYSGGDYFARRTDQRGDEDDDVSPRPFGTQPKTPEHPLRTPQHRPRTPQHRSAHQEDPVLLETRQRTPERRSNTSDTRPRTPIHEYAATGRRPQTPETRPRTPDHRYATSDTRPRTPIHESAARGRRPQTPETRPRTPEHRYATSDTRPRTPIHESAATGRRPQTPETRPRTAQHRGRSPEFKERSPGPRSKTPEPQPTYFEPSSRTPKMRSKTPEPSPRIPQTQPISHRSLDNAALQMPRTVENRPRTPEHQPRTVQTKPRIHESRPKTAVYGGRSPDHREKISQTQQTSFEMGQRSSHAYNYLEGKAESVYIEKDDESVLLFPELILSPQERPPSRLITLNHRGYETPNKQEEHCDEMDDSASTDDDKFSFVDDHDEHTVSFYPETTSKSGSSEQEEQIKANNEPPELPDESQSFSLAEISRMKGIITKNETRDEMQSILSESYVSVGDYKVRASVSATLQRILQKHGDIASGSKLQSLATRSYYLDMLASVVFELQTTPLKYLKESRVVEMVAIVRDVESVKIKAGWLKPVLEEIVEAVKHHDEHKMSIMKKEVWERDVLLARQEAEKQVKELEEKEKKMKEWRARMTEMAAKLGDLDMKRARLHKSFTFLSSKVDKFQGKPLLQGIV
ncbi:Phospholipase-like [Arabidopsis thaliana x Arabidopsis arenosa]|uniref:Phospholipase-like n=1 Tax=Arabidopsis thaliana x Arabidopsis arenosa TaxID=1240361 RepID=A0A8T2A3W4_9BRAS|nr:Phospholipase-like [Arabidopsis thaliana x Arabidopsis arenosa]